VVSPQVFLNKIFYGEELLAPRPTPMLEDHLSSAVRDCLFNLFAVTLRIGGLSSIRNLRKRHAVVTGTHLRGYILHTKIIYEYHISTTCLAIPSAEVNSTFVHKFWEL
jgi:hypothetical protein